MLRTLFLVIAMGSGGLAHAALYCVNDAASMQTALISAAASPEPDLIRVESSVVVAPPSGFSYITSTDEPRNLAISGGWGPQCVAYDSKAKSNIDLSAVTADHGFFVSAPASEIRLTSLVVTSMPDNGDADANQALSIVAGTGTAILENLAFVDNAGNAGSAFSLDLTGGIALLTNNVVIGNESRLYVGRIRADICDIINNTFTDNAASLNPAGLNLACLMSQVRNNVLWGNDGDDLILGATNPPPLVLLSHNNIGSQLRAPEVTVFQEGNISTDPKFTDGILSVQPRGDSPLVDAGEPDFDDSVFPTDFSGNPRVSINAVDIGAIELLPDLFSDGFE